MVLNSTNNVIVENKIVEEQNIQNENLNQNSQQLVEKDLSEDEVMEKINSAQKVEIRERIITLNKQYDVYIDNEKIATVSGKYINMTGDVFKLKDNNDNILASEKQIKRWGIRLNRMAEIRDEYDVTVGYIGENVIKDLFSISKYKFHFYDEDRDEYAHTREKVLSLLYEFKVYSNDDEVLYKIEKDLNLITDSYTITKVKESDVSMDKVIFLTCIVDAIRDEND